MEAMFMSIVPTTRKMLAAKDPKNANVEIQFTEIGEALSSSVTNISQAVSLVKAYTMSIAQGECVRVRVRVCVCVCVCVF
jgi:hypothetical protein